MSDPLLGKSCLVTGTTGGIGLEIARGLARRGAHVILHGRTVSRAEAVATSIQERQKDANLEAIGEDLSSFAEVRRMAEEVSRRHGQLDVLVNNAGVLMTRLELSNDGYEMTFAVNHLAPFLLTNLLLDNLRRSGAGRVVMLASAAHKGGFIDFDNLKGEKGFSSMAIYSASKLANILFTNELANRVEGTGVTANCLHPGVINTGLWRQSKPIAIFFGAFQMFFPSPTTGADTALYLAGDPAVAGVNGGYFSKRKMRRPAPQAFDASVQRRLWDISAEITGVGKQ